MVRDPVDSALARIWSVSSASASARGQGEYVKEYPPGVATGPRLFFSVCLIWCAMVSSCSSCCSLYTQRKNYESPASYLYMETCTQHEPRHYQQETRYPFAPPALYELLAWLSPRRQMNVVVPVISYTGPCNNQARPLLP